MNSNRKLSIVEHNATVGSVSKLVDNLCRKPTGLSESLDQERDSETVKSQR